MDHPCRETHDDLQPNVEAIPLLNRREFLPRCKHAVERLWPDQAGKSLEALENIGCLRRSVQIGKTGFAYEPRITMDSTRGPDWDQLVKDRTEQRESLSATELGLLLAEATLDLPELSEEVALDPS